MKRILFILFIPVIAFSAIAQPSRFVLKGDVAAIKEPVEWVYLSYIINGQRISDSALVRQGRYSFSGNIPEPVKAGIRAKYKQEARGVEKRPLNYQRDYAMVFLQPGAITVTSRDSFANVTVTGSAADIEYRKLEEQAKPYNAKLDELYQQYREQSKNQHEADAKQLEKLIDSTNSDANEKIYARYVKQYPDSPLALYALMNWAGYDIDPAKIEPVFNTLPLAVRHSSSGKDMALKIAIAKKTAVGQPALEFTQNDTLGKPLTLSSFRGKYVLIDFWASWCGPCRAENPHIVTAFNKFKEKGFQILGVSLDKPGAKEKWMKAIHDDRLTWSHVSDLQFWDNAVAKEYGIQAIPQNLLVNPDGKIIAKNLGGEDLEKKLAEIFAN